MYRALVSFSGLISMAVGDVREIPDKKVVNDLLKAGYIEEVSPDKPKEEKPKTTRRKRRTKKSQED